MKPRTHVTLASKIHADLKLEAKKENQKLAGFHDSIVVLGMEKYREIKTYHNVNNTNNKRG